MASTVGAVWVRRQVLGGDLSKNMGFGAGHGFERKIRMRLNGLAGFYAVDHVPYAVSLSTLDDLERGGIFKGGIGGLEPFTDIARFHDFRERVKQTHQLLELPFGSRAGLVARNPFGYSPRGILCHPGDVDTGKTVALTKGGYAEFSRLACRFCDYGHFV